MSDYDRIAKAIGFIEARAEHQPTLDEIAAQVHLSPAHFQRLFSRWAGVSPKRFLQTLTVQRAKQLLDESRPVLQVSTSVGLSSGSRLHDHFVQLEAVTPGEYKQRGDGMTIVHGVHDTPFGLAFLAITPRGICDFAFVDDGGPGAHLDRLRTTWSRATLHEDNVGTRPLVTQMFRRDLEPARPLSLHVLGTNFQVSVWRALLRIPPGKVTNYGDLARVVGRPQAARAVGSAVGANPVAFVIPCHRVLRASGALGGYRWGLVRKQAMHAWELAPGED